VRYHKTVTPPSLISTPDPRRRDRHDPRRPSGGRVRSPPVPSIDHDSRYRDPASLLYFTSFFLPPLHFDDCNTLFHPFDIDSYWFILDRIVAVKKKYLDAVIVRSGN
jgi:hypothetical protein